MEVKRIDKPRYFYELTAEEIVSIKETIKIVGKLLACQPMAEDDCAIFEDGTEARFYGEECNDTIDFLNEIIEKEKVEFY